MQDTKVNWQDNVKSIFKPKKVQEIDEHFSKHNKLDKKLSIFEIIGIGIGMIVGAGVFILTGIAASVHAGPAITLSFLLSALICICAGLCYAEFASIVSSSGSSYTYTYLSFGEFPAYMVGLISVTGYFFGAVSVSEGWSGYFVDLMCDFNINFSEKFIHPFGYKYVANGISCNSLFNIPAFIISILSSLILYRGVKFSSIATSIAVIIKLVVLTTFICIGVFYINYDNWTPYIPKNTGEFGKYGFSGIIAGVSMVFLSFNGLDAVCTSAQEIKNPKKNIPIGIIATIIIVTILYISLSAVLTGLVSYTKLGVPQSLSLAVTAIGIPWLNFFIKIGAIMGLTSVVLVSQYTIIRMLLVIADDGLLPKFFAKVHKKYKTPHRLTLLVGILMGLMAGFTDLEDIIKFSSFFILISLITVCISSIKFRYKNSSDVKQGFKCPFMPITPMIAILLSIFIIISSYTLKIYIYSLLIFTILAFFYFAIKINSFKKHL
ncbi:MAG: APA family basic amino acid/polyamine antiporter [Candidatus Midichloriaceae bacterium]|jgi:APA family basic amino acid/polyamine antiporter